MNTESERTERDASMMMSQSTGTNREKEDFSLYITK